MREIAEWQPIETCPEGEPVHFLEERKTYVGVFDPYGDVIDYQHKFIDESVAGGWNYFHIDFPPSHWAPLNPPPLPTPSVSKQS